MSDMPETIWACMMDPDIARNGTFVDAEGWPDAPNPDAIKYTRADLAPTTAQIMAHPKVKALVKCLRKTTRSLDEMTDDEWLGDIDTKSVRKDLHENRAALAALEEPQRCAECDCEHGGADCNWIVKGTEP